QDAAESVAAAGGEAVWHAADVRDEQALRLLVHAAGERWGPVTTLINNASLLGLRVPLAEYPLDAWRDVMDVNVTGTLVAIRAALPAMHAAGQGSIINVTSGVGNVARADWGAYAISKWAV